MLRSALMYLKSAGRVVNSVDPDQTPRLRRLIWVYTVRSGSFFFSNIQSKYDSDVQLFI